MDKHICKAKRVDTGEWVYGYFAKVYGARPVIITSVFMEDDCSLSWDYEYVDPDTVCQCTGKIDKNNKLIFENDIVVGRANIPMLVHWDEVNACFEVIYKIDGIGWCSNIMCASERLEVIGNKFDNAELMEAIK